MKFAYIESTLTDFHTTMYSLLLSVLVFLPIAYYLKIASIQDIQTTFQPFIILILFSYAAGLGVAGGFLIRFISKTEKSRESIWSVFALEITDQWIIVITSTHTYRGWVKAISKKEAEKEIQLADPEVKTREGWRKVGNAILFTQNNIKRLVRVT